MHSVSRGGATEGLIITSTMGRARPASISVSIRSGTFRLRSRPRSVPGTPVSTCTAGKTRDANSFWKYCGGR